MNKCGYAVILRGVHSNRSLTKAFAKYVACHRKYKKTFVKVHGVIN